MTAEKGKIVVIEGTDGSGKTTQVELLVQKLKDLGIPFEVIDFPRYSDNPYGELVGRYLSGEFGDNHEVSPYLASLPFAGDRLLAAPLIRKWQEEGKLVLANRYATANRGHMAAKLPEEKREKFIDWLNHLEYEVNDIPKEDLVILLLANGDVGVKNVDRKGRREYLGGEGRDIHERDSSYQDEVAQVFLMIAQKEDWVVVNCLRDGEMRSREEIHEDVIEVLKEKGVL